MNTSTGECLACYLNNRLPFRELQLVAANSCKAFLNELPTAAIRWSSCLFMRLSTKVVALTPGCGLCISVGTKSENARVRRLRHNIKEEI